MKITEPQAVLWDMDGTLIDQTGPILRCYSEVVSEMGYTTPDPAVIRRSLGGPMASTMGLFVESARLEEACQAFRKRFPEIMFDGLIVLPSAMELIASFAARQIPQAIFTNKHGDTARAVSRHCGFARHIGVCIGDTDTDWSKPDPRLTDYVLEQIKMSRGGTILIGDSPTDAETARNADIAFYGVSTGAHSIEELKAAGAVLACENLEEVSKIFESSH
jgi:phosphoglycolate phosphatase